MAAEILASAPKPSGDPKLCVWSWFMPRVQTSIRAIAKGEASSDGDRRRVLQAVNELIRRREFVASADLLPVLGRSLLVLSQ